MLSCSFWFSRLTALTRLGDDSCLVCSDGCKLVDGSVIQFKLWSCVFAIELEWKPNSKGDTLYLVSNLWDNFPNNEACFSMLSQCKAKGASKSSMYWRKHNILTKRILLGLILKVLYPSRPCSKKTDKKKVCLCTLSFSVSFFRELIPLNSFSL